MSTNAHSTTLQVVIDTAKYVKDRVRLQKSHFSLSRSRNR